MKNCPCCGEEITLNRLNRDRAAERELKTTTIKCTNQACPWIGPGQSYKVWVKHILNVRGGVELTC